MHEIHPTPLGSEDPIVGYDIYSKEKSHKPPGANGRNAGRQSALDSRRLAVNCMGCCRAKKDLCKAIAEHR